MNIEILILPIVFLPIMLGFLPIFLKDSKKLNLVLTVLSLTELILCGFLMFTQSIYAGNIVSIEWFGGMGINFSVNGLGILQAVATCIIWVGSSVFSDEYFAHSQENLRRYYSFFSITLGATLGMFLAYDLFTMFIFFEIMSFASYPMVVHNQDDESIKAGNSYLTVAVLGGLVTLCGIFIFYASTGTVAIDQIAQAATQLKGSGKILLIGFLMFFGFSAKAGMFPLNGWLPKAHPAAPAPASTALSGILIKTGIYGVIIVTFRVLQGNVKWASFILIIGVLTMLIGAFFAFISINLKETLAYSSMSQIGFITIGIAMTQLLGEHGTIAAYGTVLHMINHTLIKLVLFTCAGIVYQNTHSLNLNKIQGFGRGKKMLTACFATASLGIMGVPFFNGYISKTLLHEAIVEKIWLFESYTASAFALQFTEAIFLLSGGFTVAYMTKLFICLFVKKPLQESEETDKPYVSKKTGIVLTITSIIIFIFGAFPTQTLDKIAQTTAEFMGVHPLAESVKYFSVANLKGAAISLIIGAILYFVIAQVTVASKEKGYINPWKEKFSVENLLWKPLLFDILPFIFGFIGRVVDKLSDMLLYLFESIFMRTAKIPKTFFEGKKYADDEKESSPAYSITKSLAYSLLLFGLGFVATLIYLLIGSF